MEHSRHDQAINRQFTDTEEGGIDQPSTLERLAATNAAWLAREPHRSLERVRTQQAHLLPDHRRYGRQRGD